MDERRLKELLLRDNDEFRKLVEEHQRYELRLGQFKGKAYLTEEERLEERELKKRKLVLKDRMYRIMRDFQKSMS
jgi:uncharacterized protein YdcH (DUF465 family)